MDTSDAHSLRQSERIKSRIAMNNEENRAKCDKGAKNKESEAEEVNANKEYNVDAHISEENDVDDVCNKEDDNNSASNDEESVMKPTKKNKNKKKIRIIPRRDRGRTIPDNIYTNFIMILRWSFKITERN